MGLFHRLFGGRSAPVNIEKRFRLQNRVGSGSMSKTWRAIDTKNGQTVCVKVLDKAKTEALKKRFVGLKRPDEGEIAIKLQHPNVVRTLEHGVTTKGEEFLVMEFVEGSGFNLMVETRSPALRGSELRLLIDIGEGIGYLHSAGFIHRDICPRNVMVTKEGVAKLIDFGLAVPDVAEFRRPGNRTGTLNYMAPELLRRSPTDKRIDVFSFSVMAFETITGTLPWEPAADLQATMQHLNAPPRDPLAFCKDIDPRVVEVVLRGLERDLSRRYPSMAAMVEALRAVADDPPARGAKIK